ncbi:hypothetical protein GW923_00175 [Candidatus Pacearchaeota archaeon]|nr:hypothetical protein [Candidatus Pacearchaeota archaeon]OIO42102.1 MAG: hypothetical protein AUJ63_04125 [Candidatus Pacearchaeota archaeon CG1_02_35_32]
MGLWACREYVDSIHENQGVVSGSGVLQEGKCDSDSFDSEVPGNPDISNYNDIFVIKDVSEKVVGLREGEVCCLAVFG